MVRVWGVGVAFIPGLRERRQAGNVRPDCACPVAGVPGGVGVGSPI